MEEMASYPFHGEDTGFADVERRPANSNMIRSSKYVRTNTQQVPNLTRSSQITGRSTQSRPKVTIDVEEEYEVIGQDYYARRYPRPSTKDDPEISPLKKTRSVTRRHFGRWLLGGAVSLFVGFEVVSWASDRVADMVQRIDQGGQPSKTVYAVVGHGDSDRHKTVLHLYVDADARRMIFIELPGGDAAKFHVFLSRTFSGVDMDRLHLDISLQQVDGGKYQVLLSATERGSSRQYADVLVDRGGYFGPVK
jgi:hypothetical protein